MRAWNLVTWLLTFPCHMATGKLLSNRTLVQKSKNAGVPKTSGGMSVYWVDKQYESADGERREEELGESKAVSTLLLH